MPLPQWAERDPRRIQRLSDLKDRRLGYCLRRECEKFGCAIPEHYQRREAVREYRPVVPEVPREPVYPTGPLALQQRGPRAEMEPGPTAKSQIARARGGKPLMRTVLHGEVFERGEFVPDVLAAGDVAGQVLIGAWVAEDREERIAAERRVAQPISWHGEFPRYQAQVTYRRGPGGRQLPRVQRYLDPVLADELASGSRPEYQRLGARVDDMQHRWVKVRVTGAPVHLDVRVPSRSALKRLAARGIAPPTEDEVLTAAVRAWWEGTENAGMVEIQPRGRGTRLAPRGLFPEPPAS